MTSTVVPHNSAGLERRRVLIVAASESLQPYLQLRGPAPFRTWDILEAESLERAHFVLQMDHCNAILLDGSLYQPNDEGLPWLLEQHPLPTLLVADVAAALPALQQGASYWLPRDTALGAPALLSEMLHQVVQAGEWQRRARVAGESLQDVRRQVSRLVSLLWEVTPTTSGTRWFTQRHMMERLHQEVSRCARHDSPLSVVLGEMRNLAQSRLTPEESHDLASWTAERISTAKRRCDVAGQYGPHGFMLLLPGSRDLGAVTCCKRLLALLEAADGPFPHLQVFFGIASYSPTTSTVKALLSRAEERLEQACAGAGERVVA